MEVEVEEEVEEEEAVEEEVMVKEEREGVQATIEEVEV